LDLYTDLKGLWSISRSRVQNLPSSSNNFFM
jgi:hypothetical protein